VLRSMGGSVQRGSFYRVRVLRTQLLDQERKTTNRLKRKKPSLLFRHPPSESPHSSATESAPSNTLHAGGRSTGSPAPEAETDLGDALSDASAPGAYYNAADSWEMLIVRSS
jgi:hypothetical protein